jgi:hypothetical protein
VEHEEIVGAILILRVLHDIATAKLSPESHVGKAQLAGLVIVPHLNLDTARPLRGPVVIFAKCTSYICIVMN